MDSNYSRPQSVESFNQNPNQNYFYQNYQQNGPQFWSQNNEYLTQYYSQYYREYYRRLIQSQQQSQQQHVLKTPLKYGSIRGHSRAQFSQSNNQLMVIQSNQKSILFYSLNDLLNDYLFPKDFLSLIRFPFDSKEMVLQFIRFKLQLNELNFELKLILKIIQMLLKQNSIISGLDLSGISMTY
jgi:hypothetical protein